MLDNLKICGVTDRETVRYCADLGIGAVGVVFYTASPRNLTPQAAREILALSPPEQARVGVFVNRGADEILEIAHLARLTTIQLHGTESLATQCQLQAAGLRVIKVLKSQGAQLMQEAGAIPATTGVLLECGQGTLPGGNGTGWQWQSARAVARVRPVAIAGGLNAANLVAALQTSGACACDLSTGVEDHPGHKNHTLISRVAAQFKTLALDEQSFWHPL